MILRGFRYKLEPTPEQGSLFRQFAGVCRLIYNLALEQRRDWYRHFERQTGKKLNYISQARELTALRSEYDWVAAVSQTCEQQALRDLDKAFSRFFKGAAGYPAPRKKGSHESFRFQGRELETKRLNAKWSAVRLPKIGWVKYRDTRALPSAPVNATVTCAANGWHIAFACEVEAKASAGTGASVGIDRGVANTLSFSTGERLSVPTSLAKVDKLKRRAQRTASRRLRGSKRRALSLQKVAKLSAQAARMRRDWHHRVALDIAQRFELVVLEDLRIKNMTASARGTAEAPGKNVAQKAGLNRSILSQGWGGFEAILAYKLEDRGGALICVNPAFTSQTCSECGVIDRESRESQAVFSCRHCGFRGHADNNAAVNILRRNTASMRMEEGHQLSVEVRTGRGLRPPEKLPASAGSGC